MAENRDPITNSACDIKHSQGPTFALLCPANAIRSQASVCGCPFRKRGTVAVGERMRQWIIKVRMGPDPEAGAQFDTATGPASLLFTYQ